MGRSFGVGGNLPSDVETIHVIRDSVNDCVQIIKPLEGIAEEVWGPPVTLAYYQDVHYEGTIEIPISPGAQPVAGDTSIQLGGFLLEEAQQATKPPWKVFEQDLGPRIELPVEMGKTQVNFSKRTGSGRS